MTIKYQLIEDTDITRNETVIQRYKPLATPVIASEFKSRRITPKEKLAQINKYAKNGKQYIVSKLGISNKEFSECSWGIILGIAGWRSVNFDIQHVNEPHKFGDFFIRMPPAGEPYVTNNYENCLQQVKRLITVYRKPFTIYQTNRKDPVHSGTAVDIVNFTPGHPVDGPLSDGYGQYAIPVYLYMLIDKGE